jgi:hypothetical protein
LQKAYWRRGVQDEESCLSKKIELREIRYGRLEKKVLAVSDAMWVLPTFLSREIVKFPIDLSANNSFVDCV